MPRNTNTQTHPTLQDPSKSLSLANIKTHTTLQDATKCLFSAPKLNDPHNPSHPTNQEILHAECESQVMDHWKSWLRVPERVLVGLVFDSGTVEVWVWGFVGFVCVFYNSLWFKDVGFVRCRGGSSLRSCLFWLQVLGFRTTVSTFRPQHLGFKGSLPDFKVLLLAKTLSSLQEL